MDNEVEAAGTPKKQSPGERRPILRVGARLTANAYSPSGILVLRAGRVIENEHQLSRLFRHGVNFGAKRRAESDESTGDGNRTTDLDPKDKELEANIRRATVLKSEAVHQVESVFGRIESSGEVDIPLVQETVSGLVTELMGDRLALASLVQLKNADSYTFTHSVNVAILAMYLAMNARLEDDLERIGTGAILHDIGKVATPSWVLRKNGPLDDLEMKAVQRHPGHGAELLLESGFQDSIALSCVLDHHEKLTGKGYPRGKKATELSPYAKITGLADIYDALTTNRPYRKAMKPEDALRLMIQEMEDDLDPWLLECFVATVGNLTERTSVTSEGGVVPRVRESGEDEVAQPVHKVERSITRLDVFA
jgi:putative nucleotidyltransferase with HDIG domain